ncbi:ribokinase [Limimaricola hongkongensis]|uniref:Ribokinase n=1 Tax=Limimaricola hongkongensis DSM 17492 TaxID=1122180 RepID=A0A017HFL4_9RHOB|nr:ribokinase [Limimaricola hongkongensis]EYD73151.1 Ribokinase [Limimaricola hongkongensis DSM 17492]
MTIWNLGSINADHVYAVPHIAAPGETLAASALNRGLGGKGANMSVAAARAGARVEHLGAVGTDGGWMVARLESYGVSCTHVQRREGPSGHAIIAVDAEGENAITLWPGANREIDLDVVKRALEQAKQGDILVAQNETNGQVEAAALARARGLTVAYAAAPFEAEAVRAVLGHLDFLVLNEIEARQLSEALGTPVERLEVPNVVVTLGARGCDWIETASGARHHVDAPKVEAVDTTGAGDTFTGYLIAGLAEGRPMRQALERASRAGAIKVGRRGAADAIPTAEEVDRAAL